MVCCGWFALNYNYVATKEERKKDHRIRTQFESGAFTSGSKDVSRDLQALDLEGLLNTTSQL